MQLRASHLACLVLTPTLLAASTAYAFAPDACAADRRGSNLSCNSNNVSISNVALVSGPATCEGGTSITVDLDVTVDVGTNFDRYDVGIFIAKDGKDGSLLSAAPDNGAASCNVSALPITPTPFIDLDGDSCGDIQRPPNSGVRSLSGVTLLCTSAAGSGGNVVVPYVVAWSNSNVNDCSSSDDIKPEQASQRCNDSMTLTVPIAVMPGMTKTDGITVITPGVPTTYTVLITNNTGVRWRLGNSAVLVDPAVANLTVSSVACTTTTGGAVCPAAPAVADLQGAGITIPDMPHGSTMTFTITATVDSGTAAGTLIANNASVTANGQTVSATDSNTVVYPSLLHLKTVSVVSDPINGTVNPKFIPGAIADYTLRVTNTGQGTVSTDTMIVEDAIPANTELFIGDLGAAGSGPVAFVDGSPASALTWTYSSLLALPVDDLYFYDGLTWDYQPVGPYDPNVTHIRMNPKGVMAANAGAGSPYFELRFRVRVK